MCNNTLDLFQEQEPLGNCELNSETKTFYFVIDFPNMT